jgi:glutathione S-transferase
MRLYNNRPSPYGRKVLVVAHEKQLLDRINVIQIDPWSDPPELVAATPLGKVPAFVTEDGMLVTESTLISEYFDAIGSGAGLLGADRLSTLRRTALAQGLIDAAFALVVERRRPADRQWEAWSASTASYRTNLEEGSGAGCFRPCRYYGGLRARLSRF